MDARHRTHQSRAHDRRHRRPVRVASGPGRPVADCGTSFVAARPVAEPCPRPGRGTGLPASVDRFVEDRRTHARPWSGSWPVCARRRHPGAGPRSGPRPRSQRRCSRLPAPLGCSRSCSATPSRRSCWYRSICSRTVSGAAAPPPQTRWRPWTGHPMVVRFVAGENAGVRMLVGSARRDRRNRRRRRRCRRSGSAGLGRYRLAVRPRIAGQPDPARPLHR